jgi:hypothetical protein
MHRRTWRLLFLAAAEYRATEKDPLPRQQDMPTQALPCHCSGAGWLAQVRQASGVQMEEQEHEG